MTDWMIATEGILKEIPFDPTEIPEIAKRYGTDLRDGTKELFAKLNNAEVPVLVFSAGLGDVVEAVLRHQGVLFDNMKVNIVSLISHKATAMFIILFVVIISR